MIQKYHKISQTFRDLPKISAREPQFGKRCSRANFEPYPSNRNSRTGIRKRSNSSGSSSASLLGLSRERSSLLFLFRFEFLHRSLPLAITTKLRAISIFNKVDLTSRKWKSLATFRVNARARAHSRQIFHTGRSGSYLVVTDSRHLHVVRKSRLRPCDGRSIPADNFDVVRAVFDFRCLAVCNSELVD